MRRFLILGACVLVAGLFAAPAKAQIEAPFGLCHAVPVAGPTVNQYILIQPNQSGVVNGHDNHPKDIVLQNESDVCPRVDGNGDGNGDGGGGGGGAAGAGGGPPAATEQPTGTLALTGFDALVVGLIGLGMAAAGLGVRHLTRA